MALPVPPIIPTVCPDSIFKLTLDKGYQLIESEIEKALVGSKVISGEAAFKLYDTYGFPYELTSEIAQEKGLSVDEAGFKTAMQEQKERARASAQKVVITDDLNYINNPATNFIGYAQKTSHIGGNILFLNICPQI